jgi:predicted Zn finger-like uncharacterized protein
MRELYNSILNIDILDYLDCWKLYMDLVETEFNPEDFEFYDWNLIEDHEKFHELQLFLKNINDNMPIIIDIVENIIKDITEKYDGYFIIDNKIYIDYGLVKCMKCGNIWDGNAQCLCGFD